MTKHPDNRILKVQLPLASTGSDAIPMVYDQARTITKLQRIPPIMEAEMKALGLAKAYYFGSWNVVLGSWVFAAPLQRVPDQSW